MASALWVYKYDTSLEIQVILIIQIKKTQYYDNQRLC